jgi:hypothetical protein
MRAPKVAPDLTDAVDAELGKMLAADIHWMAQRADLPPGARPSETGSLMLDAGPSGYGDTRYTRVLRRLAVLFLDTLEAEAAGLEAAE